MDEILWIYQKQSNNVHDLKSHIWDEWADEDGFIGNAYGYQMGIRNQYKDVTEEGLQKAFPDVKITRGATVEHACKENHPAHEVALRYGEHWLMTQIDKVIYDLKNDPFSRRIMTTMWNPAELHEMALEPCAYSMTFNVTEEDGQLVLNGILNQRSQDMLAANGWNVAQYAILLMMIAQVCNMVPGELVHVIADCHIYDRHVPMIEELLKREGYPAPKVRLNPAIKDFYDFTTEDLIVEDYQFGEQIKDIPIAI